MDNIDENVVRILEVSLKNYKNTSNGRVEMSNISNIENNLGDILGIYGQNGSGKTSIITAVRIIKDIFSGEKLPKDIDEHIMYGKDEAEIDILFYIKKDEERYRVRYNVIFFKHTDGTFIKKESIHYWYKASVDENWDRVKSLIVSKYNENNIYPK